MRAKFQLVQVVTNNPGTPAANEQLTFRAVSEKPFDSEGNSEDNSFSKWTPTGDLKMTVTNPALYGTMKEGEKYYLDFSKAED